MGATTIAFFENRKLSIYLPISLLLFSIVLLQFPQSTLSVFSSEFVWSAINKSLEEDRLLIVDANNEKIKIRGCVRVVLHNHGSEKYIESNHSGEGVVKVNVTFANFSTSEVLEEVTKQIDLINPGICVPCVVVISLVNITTIDQERQYRTFGKKMMAADQVKYEEKIFQDYKLGLSEQLTRLLQYKTPIQARHLIMVRLVDTEDELTKCHGKKYTRYPRRLVSIWEQVLFDHFREARVIQGALKTANSDEQNKVLISGKESGIWVWMCEEIIRRLEITESCDRAQGESEKEKCYSENANFTTSEVKMTKPEQCRMYRPRS